MQEQLAKGSCWVGWLILILGRSLRAEELEAAVAENAALRAQAARSASLKGQHAQLLERLRGAREAAAAACAERDAALADVAALRERVRN
jgi:hypothetical protein